MPFSDKVIYYGVSNSPFGLCFIAWFDTTVVQLSFIEEHEQVINAFIQKFGVDKQHRDDEKAADNCCLIFEKGFVPQLYLSGTEFQKKVWNALLQIPVGSVTTYAQIALKIGHPKAVRAVGTAVGANPIAYIIPCHRVVRTDGGLGGYRWGLDVKKKILAAEKII